MNLAALSVAFMLVLASPSPAQAPHPHWYDGIPDDFIQYDSDGLIIQSDASCMAHKFIDKNYTCKMHDGGDTAQREGWYWLGVKLREKLGLPPMPPRPLHLDFNAVIKLLNPNGDGRFWRNPNEPWNVPCAPPDSKGDSKSFGLDQMIPIVAALAWWGRQDVIKKIWDNGLREDVAGKHACNGKWNGLLPDTSKWPIPYKYTPTLRKSGRSLLPISVEAILLHP